MRCYIGVGSNIEPQHHIENALLSLQKQVSVSGSSTFYRTSPIGGKGHSDYLNGVWKIETELPPLELKRLLRNIETELGRKRSKNKYADRTIDLDILLYGNEVIFSEEIEIPDSHIRERPFLSLPLLELDPDLILPDTGERLAGIESAASQGDLHPDNTLTRVLKRRIK